MYTMDIMIMEQYFNAKEAAAEIGCSPATVTRWAKRFKMERRYGSSLVLTRTDIERIKGQWHQKAGNPHFVAKVK